MRVAGDDRPRTDLSVGDGAHPFPLLKCDYTLTYLLSHSYGGGRGWMNFEAGYTWREGVPADQVPVYAEVGFPLPWWG